MEPQNTDKGSTADLMPYTVIALIVVMLFLCAVIDLPPLPYILMLCIVVFFYIVVNTATEQPEEEITMEHAAQKVENDKLIIVRNALRGEVEKIITHFATEYNYNLFIKLSERKVENDGLIFLTFPNNIDFDRFILLLRLLNSHFTTTPYPEICGWATIPDTIRMAANKYTFFFFESTRENDDSVHNLIAVTEEERSFICELTEGELIPLEEKQSFIPSPVSFAEVLSIEGESFIRFGKVYNDKLIVIVNTHEWEIDKALEQVVDEYYYFLSVEKSVYNLKNHPFTILTFRNDFNSDIDLDGFSYLIRELNFHISPHSLPVIMGWSPIPESLIPGNKYASFYFDTMEENKESRYEVVVLTDEGQQYIYDYEEEELTPLDNKRIVPESPIPYHVISIEGELFFCFRNL